MNHAAGRLRNVNGCAARPLPPEPKMSYEACGPIMTARPEGAGQKAAFSLGDWAICASRLA